jgi:hypothetical protein
MTQTSSGDHRGHQTLMEYAKLCMSTKLRNARYSAEAEVAVRPGDVPGGLSVKSAELTVAGLPGPCLAPGAVPSA